MRKVLLFLALLAAWPLVSLWCIFAHITACFGFYLLIYPSFYAFFGLTLFWPYFAFQLVKDEY